ncbi:MAG: 4Fe-4S dicluster domain-containing protein [Candidatus Sumerlaeota bacterium]|nr:4Fe-4S dicluster domain-containing protein [Candidatus Sumerlaeota bacterium]
MDTEAAKKLCEVFLQNVYAIPNGKKINECIQCGTCSASCPTSAAMEFSPREIIAALRARLLHRVLRSNTVWLCSSCYSCTVRCPAGIPFTDVMYELKRLGVKHKLYPKGCTVSPMAHAFAESVDRHGRNHEPELIGKYYLRTNPLKFLLQIPLGIRLLLRGRMRLFAHNIKGIKDLRKMMATIEENGHK